MRKNVSLLKTSFKVAKKVKSMSPVLIRPCLNCSNLDLKRTYKYMLSNKIHVILYHTSNLVYTVVFPQFFIFNKIIGPRRQC